MKPVNLDLNASTLKGPWTMVMANHALHHFVELEHIFDYCLSTLEPSGLFVSNDMIGRNGHQRWAEAGLILRALWPLLSVEQKYHLQLQRYSEEFIDHDCSGEGFEGVRSQDVLPLLLERFYPVAFLGAGGFVDIMVDRGYGHGFDMKRTEHAALVRFVSDLNEMLLDADMVKPTIMFGYFALQDQPERCFKDRSARRSVRGDAPKWVAWHEGDVERKAFFSEEKKQKTFVTLPRTRRQHAFQKEHLPSPRLRWDVVFTVNLPPSSGPHAG